MFNSNFYTMAKFNYSTHSISKRNEIETYLKSQEAVTFTITETRDRITDLTTFHFVIDTPLEEAKDFSRVRDIQTSIRHILAE